MLLSIVVPVYNVEKYIKECLDSIVKQVVNISEDIEIILIDDGSKDASGQICDIYNAKYPAIIKVFHNENQGLLMTRRFGFQKAKGNYIISCDSDDFIEPRMVNLIIKIVKTRNPDVIIFNTNIFDGTNKIPSFENIFFKDIFGEVNKIQVLEKFMCENSVVSMCSKVIKRSCLNLSLDYSKFAKLSNGEDSLQTIEIFSQANKFYYINKPLYNYRLQSGMTSRFDKYYFESFREICYLIKQHQKEWKLKNFENLYAIKVYSIIGRAITQSRYEKFKSRAEHIQYLKTIEKDLIIIENKVYFKSICDQLQLNHRLLIKLMFNGHLETIRILLIFKNLLECVRDPHGSFK